MNPRIFLLLLLAGASPAMAADTPAGTPPPFDPRTPDPASSRVMHTPFIPAVYPVPYVPATEDQIKAVMDRMLGFLTTNEPVRVVDLDTRQPVTDLTKLPPNPGLDPTDYPLMGYEWGVTYSGMLLAADVLKDTRYRDYVTERMAALAAVRARQSERAVDLTKPPRPPRSALRYMVTPRNMDDCGSICHAMIEAARQGLLVEQLRPCIVAFIHFISKTQFRLSDGTLARPNPLPHSLWLDDLYMSVPALAQMGAMTGDRSYFDDATKQVKQFAARMFVPEHGLFMHGWAEEMDPHPAFHWARANGWAIAAMAELLSVLPEDHPNRAAVLKIYQAEARGLAACQDKTGLWHQLLDRNDTYLETSSSALFVFAIARGVNRGWLNANTYGPMLSLGWNAIAQQVDAQGQVENVCVGTGMGFDPEYYAYRPISLWAAHGYGPVLLAGSEMINFRRGAGAKTHIGLGGVQVYTPAVK